MKRHLLILACLLLAIGSVWTGCEPTLSEPDQLSAGQADFSQLLVLGDDYMAGYSDGGWNAVRQRKSLAKLFAKQTELVSPGPDSLRQTEIPPFQNGLGFWSLRLLYTDTCGYWEPVLSREVPDLYWFDAEDFVVNDMSVPKLVVRHIDEEPGDHFQDALPYAKRILNQNKYPTYLQKVAVTTRELDPSFMLVWLGMQDLLQYCMEGGDELNDLTPLTDRTVFKNKYDLLINTILEEGSLEQGVLLNIPDVLSFPYFTYFNTLHNSLDTATTDTLRFRDNCQENLPIWILADRDEDGVADTVVAKKGDFVLLETADLVGIQNTQGWRYGLDRRYPLSDLAVLDIEEKKEYARALKAYNQAIKAVADDNGLVLIDMKSFFEELARGEISFEGLRVNSSYINGNFFSLDGYTPTRKASAMLCNEIIDQINVQFEANIPKVDIRLHPGIEYP